MSLSSSATATCAGAAALALQSPESPAVLRERRREPVGEFLRAGHHELQAAEIFGIAEPRVELEERRRGEQKRTSVLPDLCADGFGVER